MRKKEEIFDQFQVSARTLEHYLADHEKDGFETLILKGPGGRGRISENTVDEAFQLRWKLPSHSAPSIIRIRNWKAK